MSKSMYWVIVAVLVAFAIAGSLVLFQPPQPENVEIQLLENFYRNQYVIAGLIGLVIGAVWGFGSTRRIRHRARERGTDFAGRVVLSGLWGGLVGVAWAVLATIIYATFTEFGPLAPLEKVQLVVQSGLFL